MITFDSNNIIVGEIKEFLKDFNLPKAIVFNKSSNQEGKDPKYIPNKIYIDKETGQIFRSSLDGSSVSILENYVYEWNDEFKNITHTLSVKSNIYDSETHVYLGNYLRFLRDFKDINLMSMYNCFSREYADKLYYLDQNNDKIIFDAEDTTYKIYKIPAVVGNVYTFAITTSRPVEIISGYYFNNKIIPNTYHKQNSCSSKQVFIYDKLKNDRSADYNYARDDDLYMFLKVPANSKSSITILEGDFSESSNIFINQLGFTEIEQTTLVRESLYDETIVKNIPRVQLLACRDINNVSYAFADKLIQYLLDNVITKNDSIANNIKKAQKKLYDKGMLDDIKHYGSWTNELTVACIRYNQESTNHRYLYKDYDFIGYIDSDLESELGGLE